MDSCIWRPWRPFLIVCSCFWFVSAWVVTVVRLAVSVLLSTVSRNGGQVRSARRLGDEIIERGGTDMSCEIFPSSISTSFAVRIDPVAARVDSRSWTSRASTTASLCARVMVMATVLRLTSSRCSDLSATRTSLA